MGQETGNYYTDIFSPEELTKYPVTLGEGGGIVSLPPFVVSETGLGQGTYGDLFGAGNTPFTPPQSNVGGGGALVNRMPVAQPLEGNDIYTQIYNQELARRNALRVQKGDLPIAAYDTAEINQLADWAKGQVDVVSQQQAAAQALAARNAAGGQSGIPLVIPLNIDPMTGAIITAAGLIASGGNVAKLDPANPVQSTIDAAKGTVGTIASIPGQIGGIFSGPTAAEAPVAGQGATQVNPIIIASGAIGGNQGNSGTTPSDTGTGSTGGSVPVIGTGDQSSQGLSPDQQRQVMEKALSGVGAAGTVIANQAQEAAKAQQAADEAAARQSVINVMGKGTSTTPTDTTTTTDTTDGGGTTDLHGVRKRSLYVPPSTTNENPNNSLVVTPYTTTTSTVTATNTFPIVTGTSTSSYTPMATTVYQRDLPKELSTSIPALFGQYQMPGGGTTDILGQYNKIYQNFLGQTAIPQAAQQSLSQMQTDAQRLARIQSGELSSEDIRNSQQAAREAYGARGQVMGPGAIGAEILNREAIRQQRENEARAGYQASMGNVFNAAQLQTGNIFSPVGSLVSSTFNPLAPYEADVYGTNVNALNADQIAAANRQAALESAKLGQTGTYAAALGTFLGSPTGNTVLKSVWDYFSGGGNTSGTGKP